MSKEGLQKLSKSLFRKPLNMTFTSPREQLTAYWRKWLRWDQLTCFHLVQSLHTYILYYKHMFSTEKQGWHPPVHVSHPEEDKQKIVDMLYE